MKQDAKVCGMFGAHDCLRCGDETCPHVADLPPRATDAEVADVPAKPTLGPEHWMYEVGEFGPVADGHPYASLPVNGMSLAVLRANHSCDRPMVSLDRGHRWHVSEIEHNGLTWAECVAALGEWELWRVLGGNESRIPRNADIEDIQDWWRKGQVARREPAEPRMEDLCPFHDLGKEFSDCTCPADYPNRQPPPCPVYGEPCWRLGRCAVPRKGTCDD